MKFDRDTFIEILANKITDHATTVELENFFYDAQIEYLQDLSDDELAIRCESWNIDITEDLMEDGE